MFSQDFFSQSGFNHPFFQNTGFRDPFFENNQFSNFSSFHDPFQSHFANSGFPGQRYHFFFFFLFNLFNFHFFLKKLIQIQNKNFSYSFSSSSSSMPRGNFSSRSESTTIVNGVKTTVIKERDAQGNETITTHKADGTSYVTYNGNLLTQN